MISDTNHQPFSLTPQRYKSGYLVGWNFGFQCGLRLQSDRNYQTKDIYERPSLVKFQNKSKVITEFNLGLQ